MSISADIFEADKKLLWGLCYRMTGNAADADDLVQETFVRALQHPPARTDAPWRPWLVRVAMNLSRDLLRSRKRRHYVGEWLPSPVPTEDAESPASYEPIAPPGDSPSARYDLRESLSFAFLLALEALTPYQRAVLLLRDVFDYSTSETAEALGISEANAKVHLHRARHRLREYDRQRLAFDEERSAATKRALENFLQCLSTGDVAELEKLLAEDAVSLSDGGGQFYAALNPIRGRHKVARLISGLQQKIRAPLHFSFHTFNGLPSLVIEIPNAPAGFARRMVFQLETDANGRIHRMYNVLAARKLSALGASEVYQSSFG